MIVEWTEISPNPKEAPGHFTGKEALRIPDKPIPRHTVFFIPKNSPNLPGQTQRQQALQKQQTSRANSRYSMIKQTPIVKHEILTSTRSVHFAMNSLGPHKRNLARSQDRVSSRCLNRRNSQRTTLRLSKPLPAHVLSVYIYKHASAHLTLRNSDLEPSLYQ